MSDRIYRVLPADPSGFWLVPSDDNDPTHWAIMGGPDPVAEIERLRESNENYNRGIKRERKLCDQEKEKLTKRIEELEEELCFPLRERAERRQGHIITTDQIRAAWRRMNRLRNSENNAEHFMGRGIEAALKQDFGIVRCECADHGLTHGESGPCVLCNGEGWVING